MTRVSDRLPGGFDHGAELVDGTVRRTPGPWTRSVQELLAHLEAAGFDAAPRPLGFDATGREVVSFLDGQTVGTTRPWPAWTHSDAALTDVATWLRRYHTAVADFVPPESSYWREGGAWKPGQIIAHNDAAPYNAVWNATGLVGFVDWDMAGPTTPELDAAWVAFSWIPFHAAHVIAAEGFTDLGSRPRRLELFLRTYNWSGTTRDFAELIAARISHQLSVVTSNADDGDPTYRKIIAAGRTHDLEVALEELHASGLAT
jgi:hypothetical protein